VRKAWEEAESQEWRRNCSALLIRETDVYPIVKKPWYVTADGTGYRFDPSKTEIRWTA